MEYGYKGRVVIKFWRVWNSIQKSLNFTLVIKSQKIEWGRVGLVS